MNSLPIEGATRRLGAPASWDHADDGICHTLEILDSENWMVSAWKPTPAELERIKTGQPIFLWIQRMDAKGSHPVVSLSVAEAPKEQSVSGVL